MDTIKITKDCTNEAIRKEIEEGILDILKGLTELSKCAGSLPACFKLRVVNLGHVKDNIHALRKDLYQLDRSFEQVSDYIDSVFTALASQQDTRPPLAENPEASRDE
jgi:hypothetical protein